MKYKKIFFLPLFFLSLLLLTSCQEKQAIQTEGVFIGGTEGLTAEFEAFGVEEEGMYTIFNTETFPLEVTLKNKGEYEIKPNDVIVQLLGPSQSEFSGIASWILKNKNLLETISDLVPEGGEETVTFSTDAKYENKVTGISDRIFFANIDYNYQTYVIIPEVCLKGDPKDTRVCTVEEAKDFFVSGAPIIIASVEEEIAGQGIMALRIKVKNVAGGKSALPGEDFGVNNKLAFTLDDAAWECKSAGKLNQARLLNNEAEIICKLKEALDKTTLATKQVQLTLNYKYRDIVQESLRIKESG